MTSEGSPLYTAGEWRAALGAPHVATCLGFSDVYGTDETSYAQRIGRLAKSLDGYLEHFGDEPVRVFRAPGRINLRGMHVDTHGGFLNLMTHQREVLVVAGMGENGVTQVANTDPEFAPLSIFYSALPSFQDAPTWASFLEQGDVREHVAQHAGTWRNYVAGAWLRSGFETSGMAVPGLRLVVDSNLPRGAALSSSAALCLALLQAWSAWGNIEWSPEALILGAQDAEWYTGSRCGTCDQAAIVLGQPARIIHGALFPGKFTVATMRAVALPPEVAVLVINSFTRRNISGADKVAYTRNRFAYSMAMAIFQQTLIAMGKDRALVDQCDRLSHITPDALGGNEAILRILQRIPESMTLDELKKHYALPGLDHEYARYFDDVPEAMRPEHIGLRGPLLFAIAESERARLFAGLIEKGEFASAGRLMTWGHEGDRRFDGAGASVTQRVDDAYLEQCIQQATPLIECPGAYGASSAALDGLVDNALKAGALGASLTGAGIAGTVLALCRQEDVDHIASAIREYMTSSAYQHCANFELPLSPAQLAEAVVVNQAVSGAGELVLDLT